MYRKLGVMVVSSTSPAELWRWRIEGEESPAQGEPGGQHGRESARESASTNANGEADLGIEANLTGRVLHERGVSKFRCYLVRNWTRSTYP